MTERTIVIAEDEHLFAMSVQDALDRRFAEVRTVHAADGAEALETLTTRRVDLLITDIRMPNMDGIELLAALTTRGIHVPTIVVTAHRSVAEPVLQTLGALAVVDKPVDLEHLLDLVQRRLEQPEATSLVGISLAGFLQLLGMERKTCLVRVVCPERRCWGTLSFVGGVPVDARTGARKGDDALLEMLRWPAVTLHLETPTTLIEETVRSPLQHLLMEAARIHDEQRRSRPPRARAGELSFESVLPPPDESTAERKPNMSNVTEALNECMQINGAIAAALVDFESGLTLGTAGGGPGFDIELAASGNTQVVRTKLAVASSLGLRGSIEDMLITLEEQIHLIRPLRTVGTLFLYLAIDRKKGNLGMARHQLTAIEKKLKV